MTTLAWLELEYNIPDRADFYAMQIAAEIRRSQRRNKRSVKTDHFKLEFDQQGEPDKQTLETRTKRSKAFWYAVVGRAPEKAASVPVTEYSPGSNVPGTFRADIGAGPY